MAAAEQGISPEELLIVIRQAEVDGREMLDLSDKGIARLPEEIGRLVNLQYLDVSGNQLTPLPEWLGQLVNLQQLNLRDNQITDLPPSLASLENIGTIKLDNNCTASPGKEGKVQKN